MEANEVAELLRTCFLFSIILGFGLGAITGWGLRALVDGK